MTVMTKQQGMAAMIMTGDGAGAMATGFPSDGRIFPVERAVFSVLPDPHPLIAANEDAIAENWEREVAANPSLYNGELVFQRRLSLRDGVLEAEGHLVPYAFHLWWRRLDPRHGGFHSFAWAVPVSSDGAIIAIRMGAQTANPGRVYCAAGSLEKVDIVDGVVDIEGNMLRELKEETGLDGREAMPDVMSYGVMTDSVLLVFRIYRFGQTADEMLASIRDHMRYDHEKEIEAALAIRDPDPDAHDYVPSMRLILPFVLGQNRD